MKRDTDREQRVQSKRTRLDWLCWLVLHEPGLAWGVLQKQKDSTISTQERS